MMMARVQANAKGYMVPTAREEQAYDRLQYLIARWPLTLKF
jgi:hypothetical protein